jgi:hypothetical protein
MNAAIEALALLTPFDIDIPKRRIGPNGDGGYVFADAIVPGQPVLSYGISTEYRFDEEMAQAGHPVYMFDHTISSVNITNPRMQWFAEGVDGKSDADARLYSIEDHLSRYEIEGNDLILKMDVEGYEYAALGLASDETLSRFSQIVLEVHDIAIVGRDASRGIFTQMMEKLTSQFTIFHVHANNCDQHELFNVGGMPVPGIIELSLIRTSLVRRTKSRTLYPTKYDYPNLRCLDKPLWFFPFMPTHLETEDFLLNDEQMRVALATSS